MNYIIVRKGTYYRKKEYSKHRKFDSIAEGEEHIKRQTMAFKDWEVVKLDEIKIHMAEQKLRQLV
jgi:hypothetical protein